jgi:hypothetical protein
MRPEFEVARTEALFVASSQQQALRADTVADDGNLGWILAIRGLAFLSLLGHIFRLYLDVARRIVNVCRPFGRALAKPRPEWQWRRLNSPLLGLYRSPIHKYGKALAAGLSRRKHRMWRLPNRAACHSRD